MATQSASDINAANGVTLLRAGLLAWMIVVAPHGSRRLVTSIFIITWLLDMLDGWLARHFKQTTTLGFWLDKIVDRFLLVGGALVCIAYGYIPVFGLVLFAKDVLILPAFIWQIAHRNFDISLGRPGKVMTFLQGAAVIWLLADWPEGQAVAYAVAIAGLLIGGSHLYKVFLHKK